MKPTTKQLQEKYDIIIRSGKYITDEAHALELAQWAIEETLKDCIEIPDVSEWPVWAKGIAVIFTEKPKSVFEDYLDGMNYKTAIKYINRPQQPIKFKVGDPVCFKNGASQIIFGVISEVSGTQYRIKNGDQEYTVGPTNIKPAKLEDLGKEWSQI